MNDSAGKSVRLEEARTDNILGAKPSAAGQQDQYYAYMLRKAKLDSDGAKAVLSDEERGALQGLSDLDTLELKALARLYKLSDNSPELLQYFSICHCSTREEVAKKLARTKLRKQLVDEAVNKVLDPDEVSKRVKDSLATTRAARGKDGFGLPSK
jgi:hypothetical protein